MLSQSIPQVKKDHKYELIVEVRRCHDLADKKLIGEHSVYVAIDVGSETKRTKTINDIHNPIWNEKFCFELNEIPEKIEFRVRDDRTLLPNLNLGHYIIPLKERLINYHASEPCVVENGPVPLRDVLTGTLDVRVMFLDTNMVSSNVAVTSSSYDSSTLPLQSNLQGSFEEVKKTDFQKLPEVLKKDVVVVDDKRDEKLINDSDEVRVLPTLHVQEQPIIVEKEIEYIKPVEVHQTIVHRVKPTIVEKPVIVEKHEHYRAPTETIRQEEKIVRETVHESDVGNLDEQAIEDLKARRKAEFNDKTPIIQFEKEQIRLDTNIQQKPTQVHEKEVIYEQPIEIERKEIEHIKEKVVENVKLEKEHVHQKVEPEFIKKDVQVVDTGDRFYSQDTTTMPEATATMTTTTETSQRNKMVGDINAGKDIREKEII